MQRSVIAMERTLAFAAISILLLAAAGFTGARMDHTVLASAASSAQKDCQPDKLGGIDCDRDGHNNLATKGDDCDDNDPRRHPGRYEVADFDGHDEDCDAGTYGLLDNDRDGFTDSGVYNRDELTGEIFRNPATGVLSRGEDCNDNDRSIHPLASE